MKRFFCAVAFLLLPLAASRAQTTQPALKLIPTPQQVQMLEGTFTFGKDTSIAVIDNRFAADVFAANQLIQEISRDLNLQITLGSVENARIILRQFPIERAASPVADYYSLLISPRSIEINGESS